MPFHQVGHAKLYYEDHGDPNGSPILTNHGVCENADYWNLGGTTKRLTDAGYRVVHMNMRAHKNSEVAEEPKGYDVDTMSEDIGALADHLGIDKFHFLSHATGGMVAMRYAMNHHDRLLSMMATDTSAATAPSDKFSGPDIGPDLEVERLPHGKNPTAAYYRNEMSWDDRKEIAKKRNGPFLNRLDFAPDPDFAWDGVFQCLSQTNPLEIAEFHDGFYDDLNPYVGKLRAISCPTLVLVGAWDYMFIKPSEQMHREIPKSRHVVLSGCGHMTNFEAPERFHAEVLRFLADVEAGVFNQVV